MKILKSPFFLTLLFILFCVYGNKNHAWGEGNQNGEEVLSDQELLETVCLFATAHFEKVLTSEIEKNAETHFMSSPEVGIYFIDRNINILEQLQAPEVGIVPQKAWKWDLSFNYGWYGKLLRKVGKTDEAQAYFIKALKLSQDAGGKFTSEEEFLEFLEKWEKSYLKYSRSKPPNSDNSFPMPKAGFEERK